MVIDLQIVLILFGRVLNVGKKRSWKIESVMMLFHSYMPVLLHTLVLTLGQAHENFLHKFEMHD